MWNWFILKNIRTEVGVYDYTLPEPQSFQWIKRDAEKVRNITDKGDIKIKNEGFYPTLVLKYVPEGFDPYETLFSAFLNSAYNNIIKVTPNEDFPDVYFYARLKNDWTPDYWRDYIWGKHYDFEFVFEAQEAWNLIPVFPTRSDFIHVEDDSVMHETTSTSFEPIKTFPFIVNDEGRIWLFAKLKNMEIQYRATKSGAQLAWMTLSNSTNKYEESFNFLDNLSAWTLGNYGKVEIQGKIKGIVSGTGYMTKLQILSEEAF